MLQQVPGDDLDVNIADYRYINPSVLLLADGLMLITARRHRNDQVKNFHARLFNLTLPSGETEWVIGPHQHLAQ